VLRAFRFRIGRTRSSGFAVELGIPEAFLLTAGAFAQLNPVQEGLEVDTERMPANLLADGGLMLAGAAMMALAPHLGSPPAHEAVGAAAPG